jgi:hypothetical protein
MNVSPHHQRPTKYPWPGLASARMVVLAIVLIALIGFILIADPFTTDDASVDPTATRVTAARGL